MGYLGRRIGLSQDQGDSNPGGADGAVGGGILDLFAHGYFERQGDIYNAPSEGAYTGHTATGGVISEYTSGSDVYRAHVFTASGTFDISSLGQETTIEYLLVGGGGGGGYSPSHYGGGGGAGGLLSNHPDVPDSNPIGAIRQPSYTVAVGEYTVEIGAGGAQASPGSVNGGIEGGNSNFYPTPVSHPSPTYLRAVGGGGGGSRPAVSGDPGGSGGGAGESSPSPGYGTGTTNQGTPGGYIGDGQNGPSSNGHGGGGALTAGNTKANSAGGDGLQVKISGSPSLEQPAGAPGPSPVNGYFAGGGAGAKNNPAAPGGFGGGGDGGAYNGAAHGEFGTQSTGGGGGGGVVNDRAGGGGSGICIIRYKIAEISGNTKATGGSVSFYNDGGTEKVIHAFTSSGTLTNTTGSTFSVEYVLIGGGGAGGYSPEGGAGGGGAGQYLLNGSYTLPTSAQPIVIGGGGTISVKSDITAGNGSNTTAFGATAYGGGAGGNGYGGPPSGGLTPGRPGAGPDQGSGGGGAYYGPPGGPHPGGASSGPGGNAGGSGYWVPGAAHNAGGGGGAGGAGQNAGPDGTSGDGGIGVRLPSSFRDPAQSGIGAPGPGSTGNWVAGGGGGGGSDSGNAGGMGGGDNGPFAGGGNGAAPGRPAPLGPADQTAGKMNTGAGGGGGGSGTGRKIGGAGGSGIVLIAYPA